MEEERSVGQILAEALSVHSDVRRRAEMLIHEHLDSEAFVVCLVGFSSSDSPNAPTHLKQLALIIITRHVERCWRNLSTECKNYIMNYTFQLYVESNSALSKAGMQIILAVLHRGSREERSDVLNNLFRHVDNTNADSVVLFLKCACAVAENTSEYILEELFSKSYAVVSMCLGNRDRKQLRYAAKFVGTFCLKICSGRQAGEFDFSGASIEKLCAWIKDSLELLDNASFLNVTSSSENVLIFIELYRVYACIAEAFPLYCDAFYHAFYRHVSSLLLTISNEVLANVKQNGLIYDMLSGYTSDCDAFNLDVLACHGFRVLSVVNWMKISIPDEDLRALILLVVHYMRLSPKQLDMLEHAPEDFLLFEDDDSQELTARHIGLDVLQCLCKSYRNSFVSAFIAVGEELLNCGDGQAGLIESYLWGLASVGKVVGKYIVKKEIKRSRTNSKAKLLEAVDEEQSQLGFYLQHMRRVIVLATSPLLYSSNLMVRARAALVVANFTDVCESSSELETISFAIMNLLISETSNSINMQACKALGIVLTNIKGSSKFDLVKLKLNSSQLMAVLIGSFNMYGEKTMHIILETMTSLVEYAKSIIDFASCKAMIETVFRVFELFSNDPFVVEVATSLLLTSLRNTEHSFAILVERHLASFGNLILKCDHSAISQSIVQAMVAIAVHPFIHTYPNGIAVMVTILHLLVSVFPLVKHCKDVCTESLLCIICKQENSRSISLYVSDRSMLQFVISLFIFVNNNMEHLENASTRFTNAIVGLFCHLLFEFADAVEIDKIIKMAERYLQIMQASESIGVRKSLLFGLVYLFARKPSLMISVLSQMPRDDGSTLNPFLFVYNQWTELHPTLIHSKYNLSISSLGLIELLKVFNASENNYPFALHTCRLLLKAHSKLIDEGFMESQGDFYDNTDQNSGSISISDIESLSDNFNDDEEEFEMNGTEGHVAYAPAEMYLSDMVDANGDDALGFCVGVDEDVIYKPHTDDPLAAVSVQERLRSCLNSMRLPTSGDFPVWVQGMSAQEQAILQSMAGY